TVTVLYGRSAQGGAPEVVREALLPLDLARVGANGHAVPPLTNLPPADLVSRMVDEYLFAVLAHAAMESFAAENAARLSVMMAARQNIDSTLDELTGVVRRLRQEQITTELIELATGAEALRVE
ncbi:MAG TPA: F0F1 ATP synthase subunit gamma, partial [Azospirillum sp.]